MGFLQPVAFVAIDILSLLIIFTVGFGIPVANWPVLIGAYVIMIFARVAFNLAQKKAAADIIDKG
jgi:hypothetical protein